MGRVDAAADGGFAAADVAAAVRALRGFLWRAIDAGVFRPLRGRRWASPRGNRR